MLSSDPHPRVGRIGSTGRYLGDLYHFLLVSSWSRLLMMLALLYVASNCLFAIAYLVAGDSIQGGRPGSFADAFFFSVQTMATIGYGNLLPRTLWANILVTLESLVGLLGLAVLTGLIFAKFSRPTARVLFSRVAVIALWDGVPSLIFRMANQRGNQIVEARVHVVLARNETTAEGEVFRRLHDLDLIRNQTALFALSWTAIHPISDASPLYEATQASLAESEAEIIVSLTGLDESFSETVHARYSYRAGDIVWGARFVDVLSHLPDGRPQIDYTRFHDVIQAEPTGD
jgi:inward rectifier potassium channel